MNDSILIENQSDLRASMVRKTLQRAVVMTAGVTLVACGGSSGITGSVDPVDPGKSALKPGFDTPFNGGAYIVEENEGGTAQGLQLIEMQWGRLADIYDTGPQGERRLVYPDFLIGEEVRDASEAGVLKWDFETNPVTGEASLQINVDIEAQPDLFDFRILEATAGLKTIQNKGIDPSELPPFPLVVRNAAVAVRFNDLLDADSIKLNETVKLLTGTPAITPFDARLFADPSRGGISPVDGAFHSSRLIIDFTINEAELGSINEVVELNGIGLPESEDSQTANVLLRIPTQLDASATQFALLTNVRGKPLDPNLNEPLDFQSATLDAVRAMRSGNASDLNNGFLIDQDRPQVIGVQPVVILSAADLPSTPDPRDLSIAYSYQVPSCAIDPSAFDVLTLGELNLEVVAPGTVVGATANNIVVRVPVGFDLPTSADLVGQPAQFQTAWRDTLPENQAACFVRFTPVAGVQPVAGVSPDAAVIVRFSEPLDPATVRPFDTMYIATSQLIDAAETEGPTAPRLGDLVVGSVVPSPDFTEFKFDPAVPFDHVPGNAESYFLNLRSELSEEVVGETVGIVDLAGNALLNNLPRIEFTLDGAAPEADTGGWVMRFNSPDEDSFDGPEIRGQFLSDTANGRIIPRTVERFKPVLDRTQPMVSQMQPITTGLQTPLASAGSKAHLTWRYCDLGYNVSQTDGQFYDLDLEGFALSPLGGQVASTVYDEFELQVGHSDRLPDESVNPGNLLPNFPNSGFRNNATFAQNFLPNVADSPRLVHPRELGFAVNNSDIVLSTTGTPMLPMPWNKGASEDEKIFFTWRNTATTTLGCFNDNGKLVGPGVPLEQEVATFGLPGPAGTVFGNGGTSASGVDFPAGVPTVGLPLITEFRCYPTEESSLNNFDVSIASTSSNRPFFRAFSTGGLNTSGNLVVKDPDLELTPSGGFNGNPQIGALGATTKPRDPTVYLGQLDVVLRLSRVHTIAIDAEQTYGPGPEAFYDYVEPVVEPLPSEQPTGTSITVAYRGDNRDQFELDGIVAPDLDILDASKLDVYGNVAYGPLAASDPETSTSRLFAFSQPNWVDGIDQVDGLRFLQARFTFVSNTASLVSPALDSFGVAFRR